jgi:hypothetical protein
MASPAKNTDQETVLNAFDFCPIGHEKRLLAAVAGLWASRRLPRVSVPRALRGLVCYTFGMSFYASRCRKVLKWAPVVGVTATVLCAAVVPVSAHDEVLSNRHHLRCPDPAAPVVLPHTTHTTGQAHLPADLQGAAQPAIVSGYSEEAQLRVRRNGLAVEAQGGEVVVATGGHQPAC